MVMVFVFLLSCVLLSCCYFEVSLSELSKLATKKKLSLVTVSSLELKK